MKIKVKMKKQPNKKQNKTCRLIQRMIKNKKMNLPPQNKYIKFFQLIMHYKLFKENDRQFSKELMEIKQK